MDIEFIWMLQEVSMLLLILEVRIDDEVGKGNWRNRGVGKILGIGEF